MMNKFELKKILITSILTLSCCQLSYANDEELYVLNVAQQNGIRPKILLILDNSGSMRGSAGTPYFSFDVNTRYIPTSIDIQGSFQNIISLSNYDTWGYNNCGQVQNYLQNNPTGYYSTSMRSWRKVGNSYNWNGVSAGKIWDCESDILNDDNSNPHSNITGYPKSYGGSNSAITNGYGTGAGSNLFSNDSNVNVYSANYQHYISKINSAKHAVKDIINSRWSEEDGQTSMDFGLMIFNSNGDAANSGGRVIKAISQLDSAAKTTLFDKIDKLQSSTNTPLAETLYEAYLYLNGGTPFYGLNSDTNGGKSTYDSNALDGSVYRSPFEEACVNNVYIIYVTDGDPFNDDDGNTLIDALPNMATVNATLPGGGASNYPNDYSDSNRLPYLAKWMHSKNLHASGTASQPKIATIYTVSFGTGISVSGQRILSAAASGGGGSYYNAANSAALSGALNDIIEDISNRQFSTVAPAVGVSASDRSTMLDNIYISGFVPATGPFWPGNLKKLRYNNDSIVDANNELAYTAQGKLKDTAQTIWSSDVDGGNITLGGVQSALAAMSAAQRVVYTNKPSITVNSSNNLVQLLSSTTAAGLQTSLGNLNQSQMTALFGLPSYDSSAINTLIQWARGVNTDSTSTPKPMRSVVMGDMLHTKPAVINYGGTPEDIRIVASSNAGFIHMFDDAGATVNESWAYIPDGLLKKQIILKENNSAFDHVSGIDGSVTTYIKDVNNNGRILPADGDKAWVFVGQRQGGNSYYALDVTNPNTPVLKWKITGGASGTTGFDKLTQAWSTPVVTTIPGYVDNNDPPQPKPVVVFAGGYNAGSDGISGKESSGIGQHDSVGNAIYFVDANTGSLIFTVSGGEQNSSSSSLLVNTQMTDSIPSNVTLLDSNGDGFSDRLYVGDTGGNVWRMDMPDSDRSHWSIFKFASLGNDETLADDRRFFGAPIVARTINNAASLNENENLAFRQVIFDAVLLGSGNRSKPKSDRTTQNYYFMLRDTHTLPYGYLEAKPETPIVIDNLFDVSRNAIGPISSSGPTEAQQTQIINLTSNSKGWKYQLSATGEKAFGSGYVIDGGVHFTSFSPDALNNNPNTCRLGASIGTTRYYRLDLHYGFYSGSESIAYDDLLVDDIGYHINSNGYVDILGLPGTQAGEGGGSTACTTDCKGSIRTNSSNPPKLHYFYNQELH